MSFDTTVFLIFIATFFVIYHIFHSHYRIQNVLVILSSCIFYGWCSWKLLCVMMFSVTINYIAGIYISGARSTRARKSYLVLGVLSDLGILCAFKYAGFFQSNVTAVLDALGLHTGMHVIRVVLPIGISFYTFQGIAYLVDVYRGDFNAERDPIIFISFKIFFPQLVAGPIERASNLLPQFAKPRAISEQHIEEAVWLLCWGYFLKVVVANTAAAITDQAFSETQLNGWFTIIGTLAFTLQIYCDFQAYSLIARGVAGLLGIRLIWNFEHPYLSCSIQEFWRRWHISLSTWLRDYLYISLGGNRKGASRTYLNLMITMILGGLWHGAAWNFIVWGGWHGAALAAHRYFTRDVNYQFRIPKLISWAVTMFVVIIGWFIFRCSSINVARVMLIALGNMRWTSELTSILRDLLLISMPVALVEIRQFKSGAGNACTIKNRLAFGLTAGAMLMITFAMFERFRYAFIYFKF